MPVLLPVLLEVADQLAQPLPNLRRRQRRPFDRTQVRQQRLAPLLGEDAFRLLTPPRTSRLVVRVPELREIAQVFRGVVPIQDRRQVLGQVALSASSRLLPPSVTAIRSLTCPTPTSSA